MIQLNTQYLKTPSGILKAIECLFIFVCLICARMGFDNALSVFGSFDNAFLGIGVIVGYSIIVPSILLTHLWGGTISILEIFINFIGAVMFIIVGAIIISDANNYNSRIALGVLCIMAGVVFLIDFVFAVRNTKIVTVRA